MEDFDGSCSNCTLRAKELDRLRREISFLRCYLDKHDIGILPVKDFAVQVGSATAVVSIDNCCQTTDLFDETIPCSDSSSFPDEENEASSVASNYQSETICSISNAFINDTVNKELVIPFSVFPGHPFDGFSVHELEKTTHFKNTFKSRMVANYGDYPYSYGGITHDALPITENGVLCDILSHLKLVIPNAQFNNALLTKFSDGKSHLPYHSDNEQAIEANSDIITIILGESRAIKFRTIKNHECEFSTILPHGSVYIMSRQSQNHFEHSIPADYSHSPRISITLRLLSPMDNNVRQEGTGIQKESFSSVLQTPSPVSQNVFPQVVNPIEFESNDLGNNITNMAPTPAPCKTTFYISSSMFRKLMPSKLSSKTQNAEVVFYPGATAGRMLERFRKDVQKNDNKWDFSNVKSFMLLTGTNNVDTLLQDQSEAAFRDAFSEINQLISFLHSLAPSASINLINILPRNSSRRNNVINQLNNHLFTLSQTVPYINFVNTELNRSLFSTIDGYRRNFYFVPSTNEIPDNVHLNNMGVVRLAKHLKYIAHQI